MLGRLPLDSSIEKQKNYYLLKKLRDKNNIFSLEFYNINYEFEGSFAKTIKVDYFISLLYIVHCRILIIIL